MSKIPTAEEILELHYNMDRDEDGHPIYYDWSAKDAMIEFAKLHVEACKEEYLQKGFGRYMNHTFDKYPTRVPIDEDSILNAYPIENIK